MKKPITIGVIAVIAIIGALFVIQDFGSQTITDPVQSQPTSQPPSQPTPEPAPTQEPEPIPGEPKELGIAAFVDPTKDPQSYVDRYNNEPSYKKWFDANYHEYDSIQHAVGIIELMGLAPFVDPNQDPQYYVDRYNNEPIYKEWFDSNFPEYNSIYEAVGLNKPTIAPQQTPEPEHTQSNCDSSYPDVCIPPYPPDLDCGEIGYSNFRVIQPDPHGFDGDGDGIGCES